MGNAQSIIQNLSPEERIVFMERHGLNDELIALYKNGVMTAEDILTYVQKTGTNTNVHGTTNVPQTDELDGWKQALNCMIDTGVVTPKQVRDYLLTNHQKRP